MAPYLLFWTGFLTGLEGPISGGLVGAGTASGGVSELAPGLVELEVGSSVFQQAGVFGQVGSSD